MADQAGAAPVSTAQAGGMAYGLWGGGSDGGGARGNGPGSGPSRRVLSAEQMERIARNAESKGPGSLGSEAGARARG